MRHQFGWDLPPGVSTKDIEDAQSLTCGVWIAEANGYPEECGKEATTEDEFGNPVCEEHAGTKYQSDGLPPLVIQTEATCKCGYRADSDEMQEAHSDSCAEAENA